MSEPDYGHISKELETIWAGHARVKLDGYMCLYTHPEQDPWRTREGGLAFWFGPEDIPKVIDKLKEHYNNGALPNSPLLLNPLVHKKDGEKYIPIGSGVIWCTSFALGVDFLKPEQKERMDDLKLANSVFHRAQNKKAGLKTLAYSDKVLKPEENGITVPGNHAIYQIADIQSEQYFQYYLLSEISYLSTHGAFIHPSFTEMFPNGADPVEYLTKNAISADTLIDAAYCWNSYDRHHTLYKKFGIDADAVESNLKYFNLCARDIGLYDATGPIRTGSDETFEFIVPGYVPRGAVTLLAAAAGTGKSSVAHQLCVMSAIDYAPGEKPPKWLGQPVNIDITKGICVYFSGEDGPAIINARNKLFDPEGRAHRLMFHRTDFGDGVTLPQFFERLAKMPDVPLLVIDPARKYLEGNEDDSDVVSNFFQAIEEFAMNKNCAVMVVHHLQKGANPKSVREVLDELRGSQVFIDRPRCVLGMYREGPYTIIGVAKTNIPPNLGMVMEERVFARNPKTLELIWLPGKAGVRSEFLTEDELNQLKEQAEYEELVKQQEAEKAAKPQLVKKDKKK